MRFRCKFVLMCKRCGQEVPDFSCWFSSDQRCGGCGSAYAEVCYSDLNETVAEMFQEPKRLRAIGSMWRYFDVLPVNDQNNIISAGEGAVPIDHWEFLDIAARKHFGIVCKVFAHRQDNNYATGSFKDLSGSVAASVLRETGVRSYVIASTGNIGVSFSRYLAAAGIDLYAFIPERSPRYQEAEIACFGQMVFRVAGDYAATKKLASEFAAENGILGSAGTLDPLRIEAKKTMAFDWKLWLEEFPTVYVQALSGGTGPIGVLKGCAELAAAGLIRRAPKILLAQTSKCAPMAEAWESAKRRRFPAGWECEYPKYSNPRTEITTLATGDPVAYPVLALNVLKVDGEIFAVPESSVTAVARLVALEVAVRIGPAASVAIGGFFKALKSKYVQNGDVVLINVGEGVRRDPEFMLRMVRSSPPVSSIRECKQADREKYRELVWKSVLDVFERD